MAPGEMALTRMVGGEVARQGGGERADRALRRAVLDGNGVHQVFLVHAIAVAAREVDDRARAGGAHVRHDRRAHQHRALDVDVEQRVPGGGVDAVEADGVGGVDPPGGVDEDVDGAVALDHRRDELPSGTLVGEIER